MASLLKFLNSLNLIAAIVLLGVHLSDVSYDYILIIGYGIVIWYNWETYKQLKGLRNKRTIINLVAGVLTILFSGLLILNLSMLYTLTKSHTSGILFWSCVHLVFACSVTVLTVLTFRFYTHRQTHS